MRLDPQLDGLAQEREPGVLLQRAREQPGLGEHLEAVADADDRAAGRGELGDRVHHRREPGDRAGAQVVAVGEAAGHDHRVDAAHGRVGVAERARPRRRAASTAYATSSSQFVPGNTHDADARAHARAPAPSISIGVAPRSPGWRAAAGTSRRPARGPRPRSGVDHQADASCRSRPRSRSCTRARGAPARPSRPAGRARRAGG